MFVLFIALYKSAELRESKPLLSLSILIPSLFEGLRDEDVGEDMLGYGGEWFYLMDETESILDVIEFAQTPEYAYHLVIYFCKILSSDIHLYMLICALIKMTMVTLTAYKLREQFSSTLFLFSYYCFFYVVFFSLMRQGIAVSICIYSLTFFFNRDIKRFLLAVLVAYFFHNSAVLMLLLIPLFYLRHLKYKYLIIIGGAFVVYWSVEFLFQLVLMSPLFKSNMADLYLDSGVTSAKTNILISLVFLGYAFFQLIFRSDDTDDDQNVIAETFVLIASSVVTLLFLMLSSYIEVAFRMSYYMFIVSLVIVTKFIYYSEKFRLVLILGYVSLFLLHFVISCKHGLGGALDYSSAILGIG